MTLLRMLDATVDQHAARPAIVEDGAVLTYAALRDRIASRADALAEAGVRPGDRIGLLLVNGTDFVVSYFAILAAGAVVVPLNTHYQRAELESCVEAAGVSVVITIRESADLCRSIATGHGAPCATFLVDELPPRARSREAAFARSVAIDADAPVMCQFSSGSTGRPKRIARTHRQLSFELDALVGTLSITAEDRFLGVAPFSHVNGLVRTMLASLRAGATLYPLAAFERRAVAEIIAAHRLTVFIGVPFMFAILAGTRFRRPPDFSSLRLAISASAPMPPSYNGAFKEQFGMFVRQLYGSTETGTISVDMSADVAETRETVGTPLPGVTVDVFGEDGRRVADGEPGEVAVKSPAAITAYVDPAPDDAAAFRDGYFFTGDLGVRDPRGRLSLRGRKKFFINKGGYKINPNDVEALLETHPDVREAAVVGVPTPFGDEKVKAVVVASGVCTPEAIIEFCRGKIADFKIPSVVEIRDSLPKSATGKVRKHMLREE